MLEVKKDSHTDDQIYCSKSLITSFSSKIRLQCTDGENILSNLGNYTNTQATVKNHYISTRNLLKETNKSIIETLKEDCNQLDEIGDKFESLDQNKAGGITNAN